MGNGGTNLTTGKVGEGRKVVQGKRRETRKVNDSREKK